jgi:peptidyl-prolyl cis-trans isomerase SurA
MFSVWTLVPLSHGTIIERILASVGNEVITLADYQRFLKVFHGAEHNDVVDEKLLRTLVEEKIIVREARKKGLEADTVEVDRMIEEIRSQNDLSGEDFEKALKEEGLNLGWYRKMLEEKVLESKLVGSEVDSKILIRDEEILEYYHENKKRFLDSPEMVEIKAIYMVLKEGASLTEITDMKRRALKITALLKDGENFDKLVDEFSDEPLKSQKGVLGMFTEGALITPLDRAAFSLKEGEISDPVWVNEGVYILKHGGKTGESYKSVEDVKEEIRGILFNQKREKLYNEWIQTLWEKSSVIIHRN